MGPSSVWKDLFIIQVPHEAHHRKIVCQTIILFHILARTSTRPAMNATALPPTSRTEPFNMADP